MIPSHLVRIAGQAVLVLCLCGSAALTGAQIGQPESTGFRAYTLRTVSAESMAGQVRALLQDSAGATDLIVDAQSNRLLIQAPPEVQQAVRRLLERADRPATVAAAPEDRIVRGYRVPAAQLTAMAARLRERFPAQDVSIAADGPSSQIVVIAPQSAHQQIATTIQDWNAGLHILPPMGRPQTAPPRLSGAGYQLRFVNWREFENSLRRIWGPLASVSTEGDESVAAFRVPSSNGEQALIQLDRRQGMLSLSGPERLFQAWNQLVGILDAPTQRGLQTSVVHMQGANPEQVQRAVTLMQSAAAATGPTARVALGAIPATPSFPVTPQPPAGAQETPQASGQEQPLAAPTPMPQGNDQPPLAQQPPPSGEEPEGPIGNVQFQYIPEWGVLVIRGNPKDVARVQKIIDDIKQQTQPTEVELLELQHVNANSTSELILNLYNTIFATRQGPLSITPLDKPNALLLIGAKETIQVIRDLVEKLDQPVDPSSQLKVYPLQHTSAVNALQIVRSFMTRLPGEGGDTGTVNPDQQRPALGTRVRALADFRTNSLIIQASPRDLEEIEYLLQKIDVVSPAAEQELRVFRLKNALAEELAPVLQQAITGQSDQALPAPGGVQLERPSVSLSIVGIDAAGNRVIDSGVMADVTVSADPNVNALLVRAPSRSMNLIAELIRQMDQGPDTEAQIKVFQIENGDSQSLAAMLQQLFGQQVTVGQGTLGQALTALQQQSATAGESSLVPLRFAIDIRTNSIIASGSKADLSVVETLLIRLDEGDIQNRKTIIYRLQNAPAFDVATSMNNFVTSQRQVIQQTLLAQQAISTVENLEREIIVIPELFTNSLIISTSPQYFEDLMELIRELDRRPLSVQVQVVIAEVKIDDYYELGFEFGFQNSLLFDRSVAVGSAIAGSDGALAPGFNFNSLNPLGNSATANSISTRNNLAGQSLSNFGMGRSNMERGFGGLVLSAASDDINILIRALQDSGRLQILSRPHITTMNNQPAFVQVGSQVPRIQASNITQFGVSNSVQDVSVGLILRIQPRVNDDGTVVINVDAERSEVGPLADGIPVAIDQNGMAINSPLILRTTAQSTILTRDGQTVAFAGLIQKTRTVDSRRVPYLSDIPVLGRLFRFDQELEARTELLVLLTPKVVRDGGDYDWINFTESDRMSWCLADLIEAHGDVGMSGGHGLWGPARTRVIYPDEEPVWEGVEPPVQAAPTQAVPMQAAPTQGRPAQAPTLAVPPSGSPLPGGTTRPGAPQSSFYPLPQYPAQAAPPANGGYGPTAGQIVTPAGYQDPAGFYQPPTGNQPAAQGNWRPPQGRASAPQSAARSPTPEYPPGSMYPPPPPSPYANQPATNRR